MLLLFKVTPFVGVWIETALRSATALQKYVTPFVGVWIETPHKLANCCQYLVTPFVGVWIETWLDAMYTHALNGHTLRGCVD